MKYFKSSLLQFIQLYTVHGLGAFALLLNKWKTMFVQMLSKVQRLAHNAMSHSLWLTSIQVG